MDSGDLPQLAEFNTPRSMDAAGERSVYDGFEAFSGVLAKRATLFNKVESVRIKNSTYRPVGHTIFSFGAISHSGEAQIKG